MSSKYLALTLALFFGSFATGGYTLLTHKGSKLGFYTLLIGGVGLLATVVLDRPIYQYRMKHNQDTRRRQTV